MATSKPGTLKTKAWSLLRLALIWARKGGVFKRRLLTEFRNLPKFLKGYSADDTSRFRERQLSFDETPIFRSGANHTTRFRFPSLPCINSRVDFDYEFEIGDEDEIGAGMEEGEEESVDEKADKFIAKFHQQLKMQRQISYLQYY